MTENNCQHNEPAKLQWMTAELIETSVHLVPITNFSFLNQGYLFAFLYSFAHDVSKYTQKQTSTGRGGMRKLKGLQDDKSASLHICELSSNPRFYHGSVVILPLPLLCH